MSMFAKHEGNGGSLPTGTGRTVLVLGMSVGAAAVLLVLQFSPRPFLVTIAAILWLVALMGIAALVQFREARAGSQPADRRAWKAAAAPYLLGAAILIADPLLGSRRSAILLAAGLAVAGLARLSLALGRRRAGAQGYYLSGTVTMAVAIVVAFGWPFAMVAPAVKLLALDLAVLGIVLFAARPGERPDSR